MSAKQRALQEAAIRAAEKRHAEAVAAEGDSGAEASGGAGAGHETSDSGKPSPTEAADAAAPDPHDAIIDGLGSWDDKERQSYLAGLDEHPLFMDSSPTLAEVNDNEYLTQLMSMQYTDDDSPVRLAEASKEKGNQAFRKGKAYFPNALRHYNDALDHIYHVAMANEEMDDGMLRIESIVRANRAAVYLAQKKYRDVVYDCNRALEAWTDNVKALYRSGRAQLALGRHSKAREAAERGLRLEPGSKPLTKLLSDVEAALDHQRRMKEAEERRKRDREEKAAQLRAACRDRHFRIGRPMFTSLRAYDAEPFIDESDCLHWPLILLYPESGNSDFISDFAEVSTFGEHLATVLPDFGAPLAWDREGRYRVSNVEVFFQETMVRSLPLEEAFRDGSLEAERGSEHSARHDGNWWRVPLHAPLLLPLVHERYVIPGLPVFSVVAKGTAFYDNFIAKAGRVRTLEVPELPSMPEA